MEKTLGLFTSQVMGYNKTEVDNYVKRLSDNYLKLSNEYWELSRKHDELSEQQAEQMEAISMAMVTAELTAIQVLNQARNDARQIIKSAREEAERLASPLENEEP